MNDYFDKLCIKYRVSLFNANIKLYKLLFSGNEILEGTEEETFINDYPYSYQVKVKTKYGENKDKEMEICFHIIKEYSTMQSSNPKYQLGDVGGDLYFWYNNEYYVIHGVDYDELDEEDPNSIEFRISVYGEKKLREVLDRNDRAYKHIPILPDAFFHYSIEPDYEAIYTRFSPGCQEDFITLAIRQIEKQKNCPVRARNE